MVKIRLRRIGTKKQASYRVVVADSRSPRDGRFIEAIGVYNPRTEPETFAINEDRALHWLGLGAQPTPAVERLFVSQGTLARLERLKKGESLDKLLAEAAAKAEELKKAAVKKTSRPAKPSAKKSAAGKKGQASPAPASEMVPEEPAEQAPAPEAEPALEADAGGGGEEAEED